MLKSFRKLLGLDKDLTLLQINIEDYLNQFNNVEFLGLNYTDDFVLIYDAAVGGLVTIDNKLGTKIKGYIVLSRNANVNIYKLDTDTQDSKTISLRVSADVTARIYFY